MIRNLIWVKSVHLDLLKKMVISFGTLSHFFWQLMKRYDKKNPVFLYIFLGRVKIYQSFGFFGPVNMSICPSNFSGLRMARIIL